MGIMTMIQALGAFLVVYTVYKFVLLTQLRLRFYKKQGLLTQYSPIIGSFLIKLRLTEGKNNDALSDIKEFTKMNPKPRAIVRNFGATPVIILLDNALKKEFAFNHSTYIVEDVFGKIGRLTSSGLTGVSGDDWKKQRKIISQSFHFDFIKANVPTIVATARELLDELSQKNLEKVLLIPEVGKISGEIIGRVFFSENLTNYKIKGNSMADHALSLISKLGECVMSVGYLFFGPKYIDSGLFQYQRDALEGVNQLEDTCKKILDDRKKSNKNNKNLAWYLLESQKNPNKADQLTDEEIVANYVTFIMGGTNTTAHVVSMALFALQKQPEYLKEVMQEIKEIYNKEDPISYESFNRMNWLSAVLKETLRVYNPTAIGPLFRTASTDHNIGDIQIKKGSMIGTAAVFSSFDSDHFEDPAAFKPQRWLDSLVVNDPYAYTPFWAGPRNCIGQHLATIQSKIIICEFLKRFDFETFKDYQLRLDNLKAYGPPDDLPMNLKLKTTS